VAAWKFDAAIVMRNDGVVQGLSEVRLVKDLKRWAADHRQGPWQRPLRPS
jgi:hypothetical protein